LRERGTHAIAKIIGVMGLRIASALDDWYAVNATIPRDERPVVFIGPHEHHSNELPWRESIADVVIIGEDADGHVFVGALSASWSHNRIVRYSTGSEHCLSGTMPMPLGTLHSTWVRRSTAWAATTVSVFRRTS
jgi:selenocysteine lyase/cysteine desulfurase